MPAPINKKVASFNDINITLIVLGLLVFLMSGFLAAAVLVAAHAMVVTFVSFIGYAIMHAIAAQAALNLFMLIAAGGLGLALTVIFTVKLLNFTNEQLIQPMIRRFKESRAKKDREEIQPVHDRAAEAAKREKERKAEEERLAAAEAASRQETERLAAIEAAKQEETAIENNNNNSSQGSNTSESSSSESNKGKKKHKKLRKKDSSENKGTNKPRGSSIISTVTQAFSPRRKRKNKEKKRLLDGTVDNPAATSEPQALTSSTDTTTSSTTTTSSYEVIANGVQAAPHSSSNGAENPFDNVIPSPAASSSSNLTSTRIVASPSQPKKKGFLSGLFSIFSPGSSSPKKDRRPKVTFSPEISAKGKI